MKKINNFIKISIGIISMGLALIFAAPIQAEYPNRPVTLVSPYGPGGAADLAGLDVFAEIGRFDEVGASEGPAVLT